MDLTPDKALASFKQIFANSAALTTNNGQSYIRLGPIFLDESRALSRPGVTERGLPAIILSTQDKCSLLELGKTILSLVEGEKGDVYAGPYLDIPELCQVQHQIEIKTSKITEENLPSIIAAIEASPVKAKLHKARFG